MFSLNAQQQQGRQHKSSEPSTNFLRSLEHFYSSPLYFSHCYYCQWLERWIESVLTKDSSLHAKFSMQRSRRIFLPHRWIFIQKCERDIGRGDSLSSVCACFHAILHAHVCLRRRRPCFTCAPVDLHPSMEMQAFMSGMCETHIMVCCGQTLQCVS